MPLFNKRLRIYEIIPTTIILPNNTKNIDKYPTLLYKTDKIPKLIIIKNIETKNLFNNLANRDNEESSETKNI